MTEPQTPDRVQEIRARADETPGAPWVLSDDLEGDGYPGHLWVVRTPASGPDEPDDNTAVVSVGTRALGEFIARAREDVPWLLDENARLRKRLRMAMDRNTRGFQKMSELRAELRAARSTAAASPARADLRQQLADRMREHYLVTDQDEADADGNLPCRCGDWREPGPMGSDEDEWDAHLADAVLPVVEAHTAAAVRRALEDAAEEQEQAVSRLIAKRRPYGQRLAAASDLRARADAVTSPAREEGATVSPTATVAERGEALAAQLARVTAERDELLAELNGRDDEARERWIKKQLDETGIRSLDFRNGAEMELEPARELLAHWVAAARTMLGDAPNYTETRLSMDVKVAESPELYTLVVQRHAPGALTPHEARQKAETALARVLGIVAEWAASPEGRDVLVEELTAAGYPLPETDPEPTE